jgi:hypothetical protein
MPAPSFTLARSLVRALRRNIKNYLIQAQGFNESEMLILCDDGRSHAPTKKNIEDAFRRITEYSQAGDVVFVHVRTTCLITVGGGDRNAHGASCRIVHTISLAHISCCSLLRRRIYRWPEQYSGHGSRVRVSLRPRDWSLYK